MSRNLKRKAEELDADETQEACVQRDRSLSSDAKPYLPDLPMGIAFFSLMNRKKHLFIPSTKNYFGGVKISELKCDSGCNSMLLPLTSFQEIFSKFPQTDYRFGIRGGEGTAGKTLALSIEHRGVGKSFSVEIAKDLMQNPINLTTSRLRFSLCEEDKNCILSTEKFKEVFVPVDLKKLQETCISTQARRHHGLIGQMILEKFASLKYVGCELYLDPTIFVLPRNFEALEKIIGSINLHLNVHLPEGFDDWEDDDFEYEDDEHDFDDSD